MEHITSAFNNRTLQEYINFYSNDIKIEIESFCKYIDTLSYSEIINNPQILYYSVIYLKYLPWNFNIFFRDVNKLMNSKTHNIISVKKGNNRWLTYDSYTDKIYVSEHKPHFNANNYNLSFFFGKKLCVLRKKYNKEYIVKNEILVKSSPVHELIEMVSEGKTILPNGELVKGTPILSINKNSCEYIVTENKCEYLKSYCFGKKKNKKCFIVENKTATEIVGNNKIKCGTVKNLNVTDFYFIEINGKFSLYYLNSEKFYLIATYLKKPIFFSTDGIVPVLYVDSCNNIFTVTQNKNNIEIKCKKTKYIPDIRRLGQSKYKANLYVSLDKTIVYWKINIFGKKYKVETTIKTEKCYITENYCFFIGTPLYICRGNHDISKLIYEEKHINAYEIIETDFNNNFMIRTDDNLYYFHNNQLFFVI